jgi:hypothetical protein
MIILTTTKKRETRSTCPSQSMNKASKFRFLSSNENALFIFDELNINKFFIASI